MGGIHTSPGPIDLFSTRFNTYFMPEARGMLAGRSVDREELKEGLLALQRTWDSENVKVMEPKHHSRGMMSTEMEWTPEGSTMPEVVSAEASVGQESGHKQIRFLKVEGNPALFRV
ncbi:hypothetical protein A0H81_12938 [Grifola frondosa]|uniref:Uncharacterized protein n=1 Tax=Grifola frondosa TaxID=5627 RepID=A0A1C7LTJ3_GRIFR|nr:hypothetical protein A0H81_12938 [Grifola frondosa]